MIESIIELTEATVGHTIAVLANLIEVVALAIISVRWSEISLFITIPVLMGWVMVARYLYKREW